MNVTMTMPGALAPTVRHASTDLPRLFLIAEGFVSGRAGMPAAKVRAQTEALVESGVRAVQLRDHRASPEAFARGAAELAALLRAIRPDLLLSVNSRPEVAISLDASLHVGRRGAAVAEARLLIGPGVLLGYSAHSPSDARRAAEAGADFLFVSPLFRTPTHPGALGGGHQLLRRSCAALAKVPRFPAVYALGGIGPGEVRGCLQSGAHGVAVLSGLLGASDPQAMTHEYLDAIDTYAR